MRISPQFPRCITQLASLEAYNMNLSIIIDNDLSPGHTVHDNDTKKKCDR